MNRTLQNHIAVGYFFELLLWCLILSKKHWSYTILYTSISWNDGQRDADHQVNAVDILRMEDLDQQPHIICCQGMHMNWYPRVCCLLYLIFFQKNLCSTETMKRRWSIFFVAVGLVVRDYFTSTGIKCLNSTVEFTWPWPVCNTCNTSWWTVRSMCLSACMHPRLEKHRLAMFIIGWSWFLRSMDSQVESPSKYFFKNMRKQTACETSYSKPSLWRWLPVPGGRVVASRDACFL